MNLAKNFIDVGIQTNQREAMLDFWQNQAGLPYEELLKVGGGTHQHRHNLNGSVLKLNHLRAVLPENDETGYRELLIARENLQAPLQMRDPDGNALTLVPRDHLMISHIGITLSVRSLHQYQDFYSDILQLESLNEKTFRWGTTLFFLEENPNRKPTQSMGGKGYRYITVQVYDVDHEHTGILKRGGMEARPPVSLGTTARISFIKDPDGNWIEISQRASLTGKIPR
ncbi:MAG: VOC family protein [Gammaproteobacteria bacterium]|nr:VOC family protein [Gammaproteobacteria bacterium]